jgi:hypothetical protein
VESPESPTAEESNEVVADTDAIVNEEKKPVTLPEGATEPRTDTPVQAPAPVANESKDSDVAVIKNEIAAAEEAIEAVGPTEPQGSVLTLDEGLETAATGENDREQVTVQESASSEQGTETFLTTACQESAPVEVAIEKVEEDVVASSVVPMVSEIIEPGSDDGAATTLSTTEGNNVTVATEEVKSSASEVETAEVTAEQSNTSEEAPGPGPIVNAEDDLVAAPPEENGNAHTVDEPIDDTTAVKQDTVIESTPVKDPASLDTEVIVHAATSKDGELGFEIVKPGTEKHKEASRIDEEPNVVQAPEGQEKKDEVPIKQGTPQRCGLVLNAKGDLVPAGSPSTGDGSKNATTEPAAVTSPTTPWQVRLKKANAAAGRRASMDNSGLSSARTSFVPGSVGTTTIPTSSGTSAVPAWSVKLKKTGRNIYDSNDIDDRKVVTSATPIKKDFSSTPLWNTAKLKKTTTTTTAAAEDNKTTAAATTPTPTEQDGN